MRIGLLALAATVFLVSSGCGNGSTGPGICSGDINAAYIAPDNVVADHAAPPPGNQWTLQAFGGYDRSSGCVEPAGPRLVTAIWSVSDPASVSLVPAPEPGFPDKVRATCLAATSGPVTITVTAPVNSSSQKTVTGTAKMTCK
jgi:hypothetical protein